jgi:hypothetical protein
VSPISTRHPTDRDKTLGVPRTIPDRERRWADVIRRDNNFERDVIIATDNACKKSAHRRQAATGNSYHRARREVDKVHRKPLAATIGRVDIGTPMRLTIHEHRDGSHGLITGTSGSTMALASRICRSLTENQSQTVYDCSPALMPPAATSFRPDHFPRWRRSRTYP